MLLSDSPEIYEVVVAHGGRLFFSYETILQIPVNGRNDYDQKLHMILQHNIRLWVILTSEQIGFYESVDLNPFVFKPGKTLLT